MCGYFPDASSNDTDMGLDTREENEGRQLIFPFSIFFFSLSLTPHDFPLAEDGSEPLEKRASHILTTHHVRLIRVVAMREYESLLSCLRSYPVSGIFVRLDSAVSSQ